MAATFHGKNNLFKSLHVSTYVATTGCSLWVPTTQLARCSLHLASVLFQITQAHYRNAHSSLFMLSNLTCPGHMCPYLRHLWPTFWRPPLAAEGLMKFYLWIKLKIWVRYEQKRLTVQKGCWIRTRWHLSGHLSEIVWLRLILPRGKRSCFVFLWLCGVQWVPWSGGGKLEEITQNLNFSGSCNSLGKKMKKEIPSWKCEE